MADKIRIFHISQPENSLDFQSPSNCQERQLSTKFDGSKMSNSFSNILEKCTIRQANIMRNFAEVLRNNHPKNIYKISDEIGQKL